MTDHPKACPDCLRRAWLLALLGPYVERIATGEPGSRSPELLRLGNQELAQVAAPKVAAHLLGRVAALSEHRLAEELAAAGCWACYAVPRVMPISTSIRALWAGIAPLRSA